MGSHRSARGRSYVTTFIVLAFIIVVALFTFTVYLGRISYA